MTTTSRSPEKDRRQKRRHPVEDLQGSLLFSYRCRVIDLSADGLAVRTNTPLAPGRSYSLKLEHGEGGLRLAGTVAWCRLQGTEPDESGESVPVYRAGIELERKLGDRLREVRAVLEDRGVVQVERQITGRIVPSEPGRSADPAAAGEPTAPSFVVRRLSRTGMVLETSTAPSVGDSLRLVADLNGELLNLPVEVTAVRELPEAPEGELSAESAPGAGTEITVRFGDLDDAQRDRLDVLIREELGLG